jgi:hypothetical protein
MASPAVQALIDQVERTEDATEAICTLVDGLAAQLLELGKDNPEIVAIAEQLKANVEQIAAKVLANTTAAPVEPPVDPEGPVQRRR